MNNRKELRRWIYKKKKREKLREEDRGF